MHAMRPKNQILIPSAQAVTDMKSTCLSMDFRLHFESLNIIMTSLLKVCVFVVFLYVFRLQHK